MIYNREKFDCMHHIMQVRENSPKFQALSTSV